MQYHFGPKTDDSGTGADGCEDLKIHHRSGNVFMGIDEVPDCMTSGLIFLACGDPGERSHFFPPGKSS